MSSALHLLGQWDRALLEASQGLRWEPLTALFLVASAWWLKSLVLVTAGGLGDLSARRKVPLAAGCAAMSLALASALVVVLKDLIDRARPAVADPAVQPLVATPTSASFPSGHAATAFSAAVVVGSFHPRLRLPLYGVAALVAVSRVYLGVHYWLDVLAGAALGLAVGLAVVRASRGIACHLGTRARR